MTENGVIVKGPTASLLDRTHRALPGHPFAAEGPTNPEKRILGSRTPWSAALAPAAVVVASIAAGSLVLTRFVLTQPTPEWDEAAHALQGALIAHDLREWDLLALAFDTYRQVYWPPLHSWLLAGPFLLTGPNMELARGLSVVSYVLLAPILFLLARIIAPRHGNVAGCLAAALALTSPGIIEFAAMNMLELPGLLAISAAMLIYCLLERARDASDRAHALLGLSVVVTYLIKTHFGILVAIAIVLAKLFGVRFRLKQLFTKQNLYAALPLVLFLVIWFAWPIKIEWTWNALVNQPHEARGIRGPGGLISPRSLAEHSGSWWMSVFLWAGLFLAWKIRARPGVSIVALLALSLFVISEVHHTKAPRHILPVLPSMFVLTGVAGASAWAWLRTRGPGGTALAVGALVCLGLFHAQRLAELVWNPEHLYTVDLFEHVSRSVGARDAPYLVLGTGSASPGPPVYDWILVSKGLLPVTQSSTAVNPALERTLRWKLRGGPLPETVRAPFRRLFFRYDKRSLARSLHVSDRGPVSQSSFEMRLATTLRRDPTRTIMVIIGSADTTDHALIAPGIAKNGFREVSVRDFPLACTQVYEYRRP